MMLEQNFIPEEINHPCEKGHKKINNRPKFSASIDMSRSIDMTHG